MSATYRVLIRIDSYIDVEANNEDHAVDLTVTHLGDHVEEHLGDIDVVSIEVVGKNLDLLEGVLS